MNPVARFLRSTLERLAGVFYDGPEPPPRLRDEVLIFRLMHPGASLLEWVEFASTQAESAYRAGFTRGTEWQARGLAELPAEDMARAADAAANDWSVADGNPTLRSELEKGIDPADPLGGVPPEARAEFFDQLGLMYGTHRVVIVTDDDPPDARQP